jgi:hypothetical protein
MLGVEYDGFVNCGLSNLNAHISQSQPQLNLRIHYFAFVGVEGLPIYHRE